jgi:hypothetical protein
VQIAVDASPSRVAVLAPVIAPALGVPTARAGLFGGPA